jgi:hypothetical protein
VDAYGVITTAAELPDHDAVTYAAGVLGYDQLTPHQYTDRIIEFTVPVAGNVTIGWVYNTSDNGNGWVSYRMTGLELYQNL